VSGGTDDEAAAGVESLLTKSLLQRPVSVGTARYAMLEMIREFALERLADAGELSVAADLHARYYARLAATIEPELTGDDPASAVDRLGSEVDDVRAALDHAITAGDADTGLELAAATWRYWQSTGQLKEGWYWLDRVLAVEGASEPSRARGIEARAGLAYWLGDFESAKADYAEALTLYESAGDRSGEANARYCLSLVASFQDDPEAAERLARESRLIFEELGSEVQVGRALMAEATAAWKKGDLSRARCLHEQALQINLAIEDVVTASSQLVGMGGIAFQQGHLEQALLDVSRALEMAVESGNAHTQLFALDSLASLVASERPVEAVVLAGAACALREVHGGGWTLESFGVENARTTAAGVLTEDEIERAWAEGSEMSLEAAVELGRGLLA
jgi:tetratricopeptide (TPR) repeat protein